MVSIALSQVMSKVRIMRTAASLLAGKYTDSDRNLPLHPGVDPLKRHSGLVRGQSSLVIHFVFLYCAALPGIKQGQEMKTIGAFVVAAIGGYLIAAVMVSWVNMQSIVDLGFEITFAQRLDTITHDVMSLGMTYLPLMTIALLIGFLVAAGIIRLKPSLAFIGYILAVSPP